ncbi:D-alanyl-D-alanine carboxypeptidase Short=DD-carboxypeptidase [Fibrisoma limi BUZ 3]|uniref:D-alanyl-D-alanine carboxypeptidase Short=DD-carboxypeptidase n=1 Tax=Fibrisoma limi BUZ 3 TaxID=1185876 RepID=I2GDA4_9BACT|nr:D-alanyl-D-alanine carboxypeptidase Short=DD-carboxypeptidase [Fibrisoma limi BUZ 3]
MAFRFFPLSWVNRLISQVSGNLPRQLLTSEHADVYPSESAYSFPSTLPSRHYPWRLRLIKLGLLSLSGLALSCSDHREPDPDDQNQLRVQAAVDSVRRVLEDSLGGPVPSMNVLIQTPSQTYFASAVAPGWQPITPDTYFRFASNSKNFTATAIMKMYQDGWLDYKAKINDLIPGTNLPYVPTTPDWNIPYKSQITIEQLLQHSAGVYDTDNDTIPGLRGETYTNYVQTRDSTHQFTTEGLIKPLIDHQLSYFPPSTGYHYSNTGYAILSRIIERIYSARSGSAKTYADYLHDYITGPASRVPIPVSFPYRANDQLLPQPNVASLIRQSSKWGVGFGPVNMSAHVGEGNGYGTMAALNKYIRSLMRGENVLDKQTVQLLQTDRSVKNPKYGLGTEWFDNLGYGHNGAIAGYLSVMTYDPNTDVSVVAMLPLWDFSRGIDSFDTCFFHMYYAAYAAKGALGYPIIR